MPALDLSALSPEVTLLGTTIVAGPRSVLTSTPVTGFSDVASATVVVRVERVDNSNGEALSVTVQGSEDGDSWTTVAGPYSFTRDGTESLVVDDPADRLRVAWSAPAGVREAAIGSVTARLSVVDAPGAPGGGSLPAGGTTGQVLAKESNADNDADWEDAEGLPTGWTQDASNPANVSAHGGALDTLSGLDLGDAITAGVLTVNNGAGGSAGIVSGSIDPSGGGGRSAPLGSIYLRTNGQAWLKTGAAATDWTQIGGTPAGAIQVVRVPLAFDTTNLVLTGITAYTPAVGDVLLDTSYLSVTEAWDGSSPGIYLYSNGDAPGSGDEIVQHYGLTVENQTDGASTRNSIVPATMGGMYLNASSGNHIIFETTDPLKLMVDDGSAGDPVSSQGEGEFVLIIAPAA